MVLRARAAAFKGDESATSTEASHALWWPCSVSGMVLSHLVLATSVHLAPCTNGGVAMPTSQIRKPSLGSNRDWPRSSLMPPELK